MRIILQSFIILSLVGCQFLEKDSSKSEQELYNSQVGVSEVSGVWGLTSYLDTIVVNKELAKYRSQFPAWFAILLEIEGDTIKSYGSLKNIAGKVTVNQDTIFKFENTESGKWLLLKGADELILKQFLNQEYPDSNVYTYRRRADLRYMTEHLNSRGLKIQRVLTEYFNKNILSGQYKLSKKGGTVYFKEDGKLEGIEGFKNYNLDIYFGTYHPFKNLDIVYLEDHESGKLAYFNWKINSDNLVLTEFSREESESFYLGKRKIILKRE